MMISNQVEFRKSLIKKINFKNSKNIWAFFPKAGDYFLIMNSRQENDGQT